MKIEDPGIGVGLLNHSTEDIRKEVKRLEQEIDHKLSTYSNFSERFEQWTEEDSFPSTSGKEISPLSSLDEIEMLLSRLRELNKELNDTNTNVSILNHHRSKLDDYTQEFRRLKIHINEAWSRAQLMRGGRKYDSTGRTNSMENLIRERGSIHSTTETAIEIINEAHETKIRLDDQNKMLAGSTSKLKGIGARMPSLNQVMNQIRAKKNRNIIILGSFISFCIIFILWWWWTK